MVTNWHRILDLWIQMKQGEENNCSRATLVGNWQSRMNFRLVELQLYMNKVTVLVCTPHVHERRFAFGKLTLVSTESISMFFAVSPI